MGRESSLPTSPLRLQTSKEATKCGQTVPTIFEPPKTWRFPQGFHVCPCLRAAGHFVGQSVCVRACASSKVNCARVEAGAATTDALVLRQQFRDCRPRHVQQRVRLSCWLLKLLSRRGKREAAFLGLGGWCSERHLSTVARKLGSFRFCKRSPMIWKKKKKTL